MALGTGAYVISLYNYIVLGGEKSSIESLLVFSPIGSSVESASRNAALSLPFKLRPTWGMREKNLINVILYVNNTTYICAFGDNRWYACLPGHGFGAEEGQSGHGAFFPVGIFGANEGARFQLQRLASGDAEGLLAPEVRPVRLGSHVVQEVHGWKGRNNN